MKTHQIIYPALLAVCLIAQACKKFLDLTPKSSATVASFYKNTQDVTNAVNAAYASLQDKTQYEDHFITLMETRSDNISDNNSSGNAGRDYNIDRFIAGADNVAVLEAWQSIYNTIYRCNDALAHTDVVTNTALKTQYEGELRFLRALEYFNAVRLWGDVPLTLTPITPEEAFNLIRNKQADVYTAIENDLETAAANLPLSYGATDIGRATRGAAQTLLAKVYLTEKKYTAAATLLKTVIQSGTYQLLPNVADVFSATNKMNAEIIFAVRYNKSIPNEGHPVPTYFDDPVFAPALLAAYSAADTRRPLLNTTVSGGHKPVNKYYGTFDATTNTVDNDFPVLRYADVYLMYAEALNESTYNGSGEAMTYLNLVRARASAVTYTQANLPDQSAFRNAVYLERRLEFPLEYQRWFDLVRTGTAIDAMKAVNLNIQTWQYLYPVPLTEIQLINNPQTFPQNPNY